ncbi:MAG: hypothetical protein MUD07_07340 [Burkholderiaceae bacterium]|nr:hypothetical protein [Burkholderiaceae bacterium]
MTARAGSGPADLPLRSPTALKSLKSLTVLTSLKSLKSLTVLTAALLLAACTSVPVSTMWKMARFDRAELLAIDPAQLRAAALIDTRATMKHVTITAKLTTITAKLTPAGGTPTEYAIALTAPVERDTRLPNAPAGRRWEIFGLTPAGQRDFLRLRESALQAPKGSELAVSVSAREGTVPPDLAKGFPLRLDLLLDAQEGWFTVLKDSKIDLSRANQKG